MDEIQDNKPVRKSRRAVAETAAPAEASESTSKMTRTRSSKPSEDKADSSEAKAPKESSSNSDSSSQDTSVSSDSGDRRRSRDFDDERRGGGGRNSRNRNRYRERDRDRRRGGGGGNDREEAEPEISPDDVLISVAGILDVLENYAFVRTSGYLPGPNDVYVSLGQVKKYGLRKGDAVVGAIRQPREGEGQGRQKFNALVRIDSVNGLDPVSYTHLTLPTSDLV